MFAYTSRCVRQCMWGTYRDMCEMEYERATHRYPQIREETWGTDMVECKQLITWGWSWCGWHKECGCVSCTLPTAPLWPFHYHRYYYCSPPPTERGSLMSTAPHHIVSCVGPSAKNSNSARKNHLLQSAWSHLNDLGLYMSYYTGTIGQYTDT